MYQTSLSLFMKGSKMNRTPSATAKCYRCVLQRSVFHWGSPAWAALGRWVLFGIMGSGEMDQRWRASHANIGPEFRSPGIHLNARQAWRTCNSSLGRQRQASSTGKLTLLVSVRFARETLPQSIMWVKWMMGDDSWPPPWDWLHMCTHTHADTFSHMFPHI